MTTGLTAHFAQVVPDQKMQTRTIRKSGEQLPVIRLVDWRGDGESCRGEHARR